MSPAPTSVDAEDGIKGSRRAAGARDSADAMVSPPRGKREKEVGSSRHGGVLPSSAGCGCDSEQGAGPSESQAAHGGQDHSGGMAIATSSVEHMRRGAVSRGSPLSGRKKRSRKWARLVMMVAPGVRPPISGPLSEVHTRDADAFRGEVSAAIWATNLDCG